MMKRILQLMLIVVSLLALSGSVFAASSLVDNAKLLDKQDKAQVEEAIKQVEDTYGVRIAVVTIKDKKVTDLGEYTNNLLDKNYQNGKNGNQVLVINMADRNWHISRDKKMAKSITQEYGAKLIDKNVVAGLKESNYKDAFLAYAKLSGQQIDYFEKNGKAMSAPKETAKSEASSPKDKSKPEASAANSSQKQENSKSWGIILVGAILAGVLGAYMYGRSLKAGMSNVAFAVSADQYMKEGSFQITESDDTFMYFTYTRVPKKKKTNKSKSDDDFSVFSDDKHEGEGGKF